MSEAANTVRRLRQDAEALIEAELPIGDRLAMGDLRTHQAQAPRREKT